MYLDLEAKYKCELSYHTIHRASQLLKDFGSGMQETTVELIHYSNITQTVRFYPNFVLHICRMNYKLIRKAEIFSKESTL